MPVSTRKFGRKKANRDHLLSNLVTSLVQFERVTTTEAKAKAVRSQADRVLGLAVRASKAENSLPLRRRLSAALNSPLASKKALEYWAPKLSDKPAGYVRMIKLSPRKGDGAPMAQLEIMGAVPFAVTRRVAEVEEVPVPDVKVKTRTRKTKEVKDANAE